LLSRHVDSHVHRNTVYDPVTDDERPAATDIDDGGVLIPSAAAACRPLRVGIENDGLLIEDNLLISEQDLHVNQDAGRIEVRQNLWFQSASPDPFIDSSKGDLRRTDAGEALTNSARPPHTGAI
jgi:hypothetical protein